MSKEATEAAPAKGKAKKGKGNMVPAVVVAVAVLGAAFMLKGGGSSKAAATPSVTTSTIDPMSAPVDPKSLAQIAKLEDITLNLSDGHFLKLGLALQLGKKATVTDYTTGGAAARALDLAISVFGKMTYTQLMQTGARDQAKSDLEKKVVEAYNGQVEGLYLTDFVMQ